MHTNYIQNVFLCVTNVETSYVRILYVPGICKTVVPMLIRNFKQNCINGVQCVDDNDDEQDENNNKYKTKKN